jgi:hypothetical protein
MTLNVSSDSFDGDVFAFSAAHMAISAFARSMPRNDCEAQIDAPPTKTNYALKLRLLHAQRGGVQPHPADQAHRLQASATLTDARCVVLHSSAKESSLPTIASERYNPLVVEA